MATRTGDDQTQERWRLTLDQDREVNPELVIPALRQAQDRPGFARAGIQLSIDSRKNWIPAFAGMTGCEIAVVGGSMTQFA
jgi:hypothetical protein